jgi:hypothetical protein
LLRCHAVLCCVGGNLAANLLDLLGCGLLHAWRRTLGRPLSGIHCGGVRGATAGSMNDGVQAGVCATEIGALRQDSSAGKGRAMGNFIVGLLP